MFEVAERGVYAAVQWLRLGLETTGAVVVAVGAARGLVELARCLSGPGERSFGGVRLTLARYLSLALEFQLAADILSTSIAPSWTRSASSPPSRSSGPPSTTSSRARWPASCPRSRAPETTRTSTGGRQGARARLDYGPQAKVFTRGGRRPGAAALPKGSATWPPSP